MNTRRVDQVYADWREGYPAPAWGLVYDGTLRRVYGIGMIGTSYALVLAGLESAVRVSGNRLLQPVSHKREQGELALGYDPAYTR